jgi:stage V sporulation protein B
MNKQSTSRSFAILGTASIVVKVLAIIYLPFQTAILGDYGNGIVAKGYNIFTFLYSLSNAGLPNAISKLVSEQTANGNYRAAQKILKCAYLVLLVLGIIVALFMALGAKLIAAWIDQKDAYLMILALSPTLIFTSVSCALRGYFQGRQNMVPVAISQVLAALLIGYGTKYGAAGTTIGTIVGALGAAAFLCFVFFNVIGKQRNKEIAHTNPNAPEISTSEVYRQIMKYSLPAILNTVAVCAVGLIDTFNCTARLEAIRYAGKVVYTEKTATALFGIYSYQYQRLFTLAIAFSTALVTSMIPSISHALAINDHRLVKHRISESYKAIYLITLPSIAGISFLAGPLITLVFVHHNSGANLVEFGTWTAILMTIQYVQSAVLLAAGKPAAPSINLIIGMVVKTILNYVLIVIPAINIKGAIIGTGIGWAIAIVLNQIAINKRFSFKVYFLRMMIKPTFAAVVMGVICMVFYNVFDRLLLMAINSKILVNDVTVLITAGFGAAVYFGVMIMIRGVTKNDIQRLPMGTKIYCVAAKVPVLRAKLGE